jgi:hypothetical protein
MCGSGLTIYVLQGALGNLDTTFDTVDGVLFEIIHLLSHSAQRQGRKGIIGLINRLVVDCFFLTMELP